MSKNIKKRSEFNLKAKDPETGSQIEFSEGDLNTLLLCEQQIVMNQLQEAFSLKTIRDNRLYLIRGFDNMKGYIEEFFQRSYRHAQRLLHTADAFAEAPDREMLATIPITKLIELSRDSNIVEQITSGEIGLEHGKVIMPNGEEKELGEFMDEIKRQNDTENIKNKEKLRKLKSTADAKDEIIKGYAERVAEREERVKKLEETVQSLIEKDGVDPRTIVFITHKKEAAKLIDESLSEVLSKIGSVDMIPKELADAEITGYIATFTAAIEASIERLRDNWGGHAWIPNKNTPKISDVVPE